MGRRKAAFFEVCACSNNDAGCANNILTNGDFATNDYTGWSKYTNGTVSWSASTGASVVNITSSSSNTQLYQYHFPVTSGEQYGVSFTISSDVPSTVSVLFHRHTSPYNNVGLNESIDVTSTPTRHSFTFPITRTESNCRFRFTFTGYNRVITIDDVCLGPV